jgi:hypothetical protein
MHFTRSAKPIAAAIALVLFPLAASSAEMYGGAGSTGGEIGVAQALGSSFTLAPGRKRAQLPHAFLGQQHRR